MNMLNPVLEAISGEPKGALSHRARDLAPWRAGAPPTPARARRRVLGKGLSHSPPWRPRRGLPAARRPRSAPRDASQPFHPTAGELAKAATEQLIPSGKDSSPPPAPPPPPPPAAPLPCGRDALLRGLANAQAEVEDLSLEVTRLQRRVLQLERGERGPDSLPRGELAAGGPPAGSGGAAAPPPGDVAALHREVAFLTVAHQASEDANRRLAARNRALASEARAARAAAAESVALGAELDGARGALAELEGRLAAAEAENVRLRARAKVAREEAARLAGECARAAGTSRRLERAVTEWQGSGLREKVVRLQGRNRALVDGFRSLEAHLRAALGDDRARGLMRGARLPPGVAPGPPSPARGTSPAEGPPAEGPPASLPRAAPAGPSPPRSPLRGSTGALARPGPRSDDGAPEKRGMSTVIPDVVRRRAQLVRRRLGGDGAGGGGEARPGAPPGGEGPGGGARGGAGPEEVAWSAEGGEATGETSSLDSCDACGSRDGGQALFPPLSPAKGAGAGGALRAAEAYRGAARRPGSARVAWPASGLPGRPGTAPGGEGLAAAAGAAGAAAGAGAAGAGAEPGGGREPRAPRARKPAPRRKLSRGRRAKDAPPPPVEWGAAASWKLRVVPNLGRVDPAEAAGVELLLKGG